MTSAPTFLTASSARARSDEACRWLARWPGNAPLLVVGPTVEAAGEVTRSALARGAAAFGWRRMSLTGVASWLSEDVRLARRWAPATTLAIEAVWTRIVHRLHQRGALGVFARVADKPGLPKALARTAHELRMAAVPAGKLPEDLARAVAAFDEALTEAGLVDRARLFQLAAEALRSRPPGCPVLLYDVPVQHLRERELIRALRATSSATFATAPTGDSRTVRALQDVFGAPLALGVPSRSSRLAGLQRNLFSAEVPVPGESGEEVVAISAPGEGRECLELARKLQREAARGVPFDRMAVLFRAPGPYRGAMAEALRRAGIPAYFARGSRLPDPAGRALLALLACAAERLSARRFAEYLSLGELPSPDESGAPPPADDEAWVPPDQSELGADERDDSGDESMLPVVEDAAGGVAPGDSAAAAPRREPPRAPRKWEQLLVDAAVIGGLDRWKRRLAGHAAQLRRQLERLDPEEAQAERIRRDLHQLGELERFSLRLLELLEALPTAAPWGEWLKRLTELTTRAVRHPERILRLFGELAPMADVGPVSLAEVRAVLTDRLTELPGPPPRRREGKVFVGSVEDARGLAFEVVFVPGLAERIFPQKVSDDPILPDADREALDPNLATRADRAEYERLQLHLATGAAEQRLTLSYPRLDAEHARPRVPSFYALEVLRAAEGKLPDFTELARRAERAAPARLGWPAPADPDAAIDATERDLATLDLLFRRESTLQVGAARYLLNVSPSLARALRRHGRRVRSPWTVADGLLKPSPEAVEALKAHHLSARAYSPTALQSFAACPYRFLLSAVHRLSPRETPEPLEQLDPLQRGSLVHDAQFQLLSLLRDEGALPLDEAKLPGALERLDRVLDEVAAHHHEVLAPAIERVWQDAIESIRADLREWLRIVARDSAQWAPWRFELAAGLPGRDAADPHSTPEPLALENGVRFRGSIDLVERKTDGSLRATDYKTGRARATEGDIVGGGEKLQPVLYALALEKLFPSVKVEGGRLFYCTQAGGFTSVFIPLDAQARAHAVEVARIIGSALERGWFPVAPAPKACEFCDFLEVCGPGEEQRTRRKPKQELVELERLRKLR